MPRPPNRKNIMLNWLSVQNLAIVEEAEIEFGPSFNVITGETGAGKSVIMGALGLLLGNRADKSAIRAGEDRISFDTATNMDIRRRNFQVNVSFFGMKRRKNGPVRPYLRWRTGDVRADGASYKGS